jgi:hypothetical protein
MSTSVHKLDNLIIIHKGFQGVFQKQHALPNCAELIIHPEPIFESVANFTQSKNALDLLAIMHCKIKKLANCGLLILTLTLASPAVLAQEDTKKGKPTVGGQTKEAGKEVGKAGKSLGSNVKHGRIVRGGKQFGKHMGHSGKNVGSASKKVAKKTYHGGKVVAKKTVKAVKKAVTP